jgi:hypothetical protein
VAVLRAGNTIICLQKKRTGARASTHTEEKLRYEPRWTSVHLNIHVDDLEAAPGGRSMRTPGRSRYSSMPARVRGLLQRSFAMAAVSYRETDS